MSRAPSSRWFINLMGALLRGDAGTLSLFSKNPFPHAPPRYVRALYYRYRFTTPEERRRTGRPWSRELVGMFFGPVSLEQFAGGS
jgi:hypothetical protein